MCARQKRPGRRNLKAFLELDKYIPTATINILASLWHMIFYVWNLLIVGIIVGILGNIAYTIVTDGSLNFAGTITVIAWLNRHLFLSIGILLPMMILTSFSFLAHRQKQGITQEHQNQNHLWATEELQKIIADLSNAPVTSSVSQRNNQDSLQTIWNVPFQRNPYFTGRQVEIQFLHDQLHQNKANSQYLPLMISGMGGIGKTQLAIEYAHRYRNDYQAIIWLNASSTDTFRSDFIALAPLFDLARQQDDEEVIILAIKHWFTTHAGWLIILDDVDSFDTVSNIWPIDSTGDMIFTTRIQVSGTIAQRIGMNNLTRDESMSFLLHRAKLLDPTMRLDQASEESQLVAAEIVDELDGLPLALDQAASYIEESQCSLTEYLQLLKTHRKDLLQRRGSFPLTHPDAVNTTWRISFQQIKEKWPASAQVLYLCSYLDANSIPEDLLLLGAPKLGPILSKSLVNPLVLNKVLEPLYLYSILYRSPETHSLTMHRLVQAAVRQALPLSSQKLWTKRVIQALNHTFPEPEQKSWEQCQRLLPHAQNCIQLCDKYSLLLPEAAQLFSRAGDYTFMHRMEKPSEAFYSKALAIYQELYPAGSPEVALSLKNLGELYRVWGRYDDAKPLLQKARAMYDQCPQSDQLEVARTLNSLGELYHNLSQFEKAEPLFLQALQLTESIVGSDHKETYIILHYLARLYHSQGRFLEAERNYRTALEGLEQSLDSNRVDIAILLNNLAITYRKQRNFQQAEELLLRALDILEEAFGSGHHRVATTLHNLGVIYQKQGHLEQAASIFQHALTQKEATLGPGHPSSVQTSTNLGNVFREQRKYQEAIIIFKKGLENLDENHPYRAVILRNLARVYKETGDDEKAESLSSQAQAIQENKASSQEIN